MYTLLIVEDEKLIRNGLRDLTPWQSLGVDKVYVAESATQALDIINQNRVDILLTDIAMPKMSGIDLISTLPDEKAPRRIIVLSGYNDFEYARQCCRLQVHDYLLKPISESELEQCVREQVAALDALDDRQKESKIIHRAQEIPDSFKLEQALRELAHNETQLEQALPILQKYGYDDKPLQAALLVPCLECGVSPDDREWELLTFKTLLMELVDLPRKGITFVDRDKLLIVVFFTDSMDDAYSQLTTIRRQFFDEVNTAPRMLLGGQVNGFSELHISCNDARLLLHDESGMTNSDIPKSRDTGQRLRQFYIDFQMVKNYLQENVMNEESQYNGSNRLRTLFAEYHLSPALTRRCCFEALSDCAWAILEQTGTKPLESLDDALTALQNCDLDAALPMLEGFLRRLLPCEQNETNPLVEQVKRYVVEHLQDELSVSGLASEFFINANYFSRLFKRTTGEGCTEYITRKRMEKARSLMETTNLKTGQVAEMVGYRDKNYFSLSFKKATGQSPTMFREMNR